MKTGRLIRGILLGILGVLLLLMVAVQLALTPRVTTRMVNRIAAEYVDGDLGFSRVKASVFRSFPFLNLTLDDAVLTYPHSRYAAYDSLYRETGRFSLLGAGRAEAADTLASFRQLNVSLNYRSLLGGAIDIPRVELSHPRIFAHRYGKNAANWDILPLGEKDPSDTLSKPLPAISLRHLKLDGRPFIVFTDPADTLFALVTLKSLSLDGSLQLRALDNLQGKMQVDSLFLSGRIPRDTVALGIDRLGADVHGRKGSLEADAKAFLATGSHGRMRIPVRLEAEGSLPERRDSLLEIRVDRLLLGLSTLTLTGNAHVVRHPDRLALQADAYIRECPVGDLMREYRVNFPVLKKLDTDAVIDLEAHCQGDYSKGNLPELEARLRIPAATFDYEGLGRKGRLALDATARTDPQRRLNVGLEQVLLDIVGARFNLKGSVEDALGGDPLINLSGDALARVDSLTWAFTRERGISGTGRIEADLSARARVSELNRNRIARADINGDLTLRGVSLDDAPDRIQALIRTADIHVATMANRLDDHLRKGARVLGVKANIDTLDVTYKDDMYIRGGDVQLLLHNSAEILRKGAGTTSLVGLLKLGRLSVRDGESTTVHLSGGREQFRIIPAGGSNPSTLFTLDSKNERVGLRKNGNRIGGRELTLQVSARRHQVDSAALRARRRLAQERRRQPSRRDFRDRDIRFSLGESLSKYIREWDFTGDIGLERGRVMILSFPLKNTLSGVRAGLTNNELRIDRLSLTSGASDIGVQGTVKGLRRILTGRRGHLDIDAKVTSDFLDANELMRAYAFHRTYEPPRVSDQATDEEVERAIAATELPDSAKSSLVVIPGNLNANLTLEGNGLRYDSLLVSWIAADIAVKQNTLQVTNALAASNMGDLYIEGFYATRSKQDIKAGFDLNLVDITAEKVITLFPSVDKHMPMLKSFGGDLDCELAATADLDTAMNLVLPSVDGILRISGKDLSLKDSEAFTRIAKLLMFRNKDQARVDHMAVTGMVRNNVLEIFPFVLDVDRYQAAASGLQNLNRSFNYHISVLKSPIPIKFGINAWGDDFSHIRYGLGKARYRNAQVPVFTKQLDTVQYSLLSSIHNIFEIGVEKAIAENQAQQVIQRGMNAQHYAASPGDTTDISPALLDSLQSARSLQEEVQESVARKRDALREEILGMQDQAAEKKEEE